MANREVARRIIPTCVLTSARRICPSAPTYTCSTRPRFHCLLGTFASHMRTRFPLVIGLVYSHHLTRRVRVVNPSFPKSISHLPTDAPLLSQSTNIFFRVILARRISSVLISQEKVVRRKWFFLVQ